MGLWLVPVHVEVPCCLWQLQLHAFHTFIEHYLATEAGVLFQKWSHVQQVILLFIRLVKLC